MEGLLVDVVDLVEVGVADVVVPLGSHVVELLGEFLGVIGLNELFVHEDYFVVKLGILVDFA